MGLPGPPSFQVITPERPITTNPSNCTSSYSPTGPDLCSDYVSWTIETSLDVECSHVMAGGELHKNLVWSYETPIPAAGQMAGLMCFYNERVELTISDQHQQDPTTSSRRKPLPTTLLATSAQAMVPS